MKEKISCNYHLWDCNVKGDCFLPPETTYTLCIDYPLGIPATFQIKSGEKGMGTNSLIGKIAKCYKDVYKTPEKYQIWGHDIGDLYLEGLEVDHKTKEIWLYIGS